MRTFLPILFLMASSLWYVYAFLYRFHWNVKLKKNKLFIESPIRMYSGDTWVVITPPRPRIIVYAITLKKSLSDCFHILYVDWYRWEDSWEARWARSDYLWDTQDPPPPYSKNAKKKYIVAHIWKTGGNCFPLLYICLLCDEVLLPWNFCSPGFDVRAPQDPPNMTKKYIFFIFWV